MSERGSFVTEFMYCGACAKNVHAVLTAYATETGYLEHVTPLLQHPTIGPCIIAGKAGGLARLDEYLTFTGCDGDLAEKLCAAVCPDHSVRIAVIPDSDEGVLACIYRRDRWRVRSVIIDREYATKWSIVNHELEDEWVQP